MLHRSHICLLILACITSYVGAEPTVLKDIAYKSNPTTDYEKEWCKLDVYLPEGKDGAPAKDFATVVWFYGGGLESGDKARPLHVAMGKRLASEGVAAVVVNYRLSPKVTYPAYLQDAAAAFAWTKKHIAEHGGDANKVFLSGHSAGAYLAVQIGYDEQYLKAEGLATTDIAGIAALSPQVFTHFTIRKERGVPDPEHKPTIDDAAPAYHASAAAPRTLIFVGSNDLPTRVEECAYFIALLKSLKHPDAEMHIIPDRDHGKIVWEATKANDPTLKLMLDFIHAPPKPATQPTTAPTTQPTTP